MSRFGISLEDFYDLSLKELDEAFKDSLERQKEAWEIMRLQTYVLTNIQLTSENRLRNVKELFRFSWDDEDDDSYIPTTEEEWRDIEQQYNNIRLFISGAN